MPQTPKSEPSNQPRADMDSSIAQEEYVLSDGKDQQREQMMKEVGRHKSGPNFSDPQAGKE